jgi:tripartite-type tricarboxylate transporter receptor subunit TctC
MKHPFMTAMTVAAATLVGSALVASAQESYPTKPIRLIVPEVVGSAADLMSRIIGQRIGEALGQPVTFENLFLEGGVEKGIKSAPDGYTIIYGSSGNLALLPHVKKVSFDPLKDLTPVARFVIQPTLIATNAALPVNSLAELVAMMKANPGKLRRAGDRRGRQQRLAMDRRPHRWTAAPCAQRKAQGACDRQPDAAHLAAGRADRRRIRLSRL